MTLEVVHRHEKLAPESGVEFRPMAPISGAGFWSVCQGLYVTAAATSWTVQVAAVLVAVAATDQRRGNGIN